MKLVELLVKELEKWPERVTYFVQDGDGEVKAGRLFGMVSMPTDTGVWVRPSPSNNYNFHSGLCTDWQTSIVTKDIYTKHKDRQMKRKVRTDFDPTKEYSVDVSGCTEEEKKEVQQAFFDAGFPWSSRGKTYQNLNAVKYTNIAGGDITAYCLYGSTTEGCNMTAKEFLELVYEPEQQGHMHAELMAQYAEDATTTDKPWNLWEVCFGSRWVPLKTHPEWAQAAQYRRKTLPDLEVDARVLVWNTPQNKVKRHFSHFDEDGCICVFDNGMSSFTANAYTAWPHWELWEDE